MTPPDPAGTGEEPIRWLPTPDRMVAFTDAAVAIALTVLMFPLVDAVPEVGRGPASAVVSDNLPTIAAALLSFVVIARLWAEHHRLFRWAGELSGRLVLLNLVWVLAIVVLPFPTEMVTAFADDPFVVRFYVGVLLVGSVALTAMAIEMRRAAAPGAGPPEEYVVGAVAVTASVVITFVLAWLVPGLGFVVLLALGLDPVLRPLVRRVRDSVARVRRSGLS